MSLDVIEDQTGAKPVSHFADLYAEYHDAMNGLNAAPADKDEAHATFYERTDAASDAILNGTPQTIRDIEIMLSMWIDVFGPASRKGTPAHDVECKNPEHATMFRIRDAVRALAR